MTIREIARSLNISEATVSICLSGKDREKRYCIKPEKAEKIRAYARSVGYVPHHAARRLRSNSVKSPVGLLFSRYVGLDKSIAPYREAMKILEGNGREFVTMSYEKFQLAQTVAVMKSMAIKHIIILGPAVKTVLPADIVSAQNNGIQPDSDWELLKKLAEDVKLYFTDYAFSFPEREDLSMFHRAGIDRRKMIIDIATRVNEAGLGPVALSKWGAHSWNLPDSIVKKDLIIDIEYSANRYMDGPVFAERLLALRKKHDIRTVFIGNDEVAAGVITELIRSGIRVPEDIGVIGFGDCDAAPYFRVPLTTVRYGVLENISDIVHNIINDEDLPHLQLLDYELVERDSFKFCK